jgi:hypothetical protein
VTKATTSRSVAQASSAHLPAKSYKAPAGRPSTEVKALLSSGFRELDSLVKKISDDTGYAVNQILDRWLASNGRHQSSWNIYQMYFSKHRDQEMERLAGEANLPERMCYSK